MDLSTPLTSWETELFSIKGIENRINYLEETILVLNDSFDGYLSKKMECLNENLHLEDTITEPGIMRLHTINERKIKDYQSYADEMETQINRVRNYLYSFYSWIENKHLINEETPEPEKKIYTFLSIKERLIIMQYLKDEQLINLPDFTFTDIRWKTFIRDFFDINIESQENQTEKGKINFAMNSDKFTIPQAKELIKSFNKISDFFQRIGLKELKEKTEQRIVSLRKISKT